MRPPSAHPHSERVVDLKYFLLRGREDGGYFGRHFTGRVGLHPRFTGSGISFVLRLVGRPDRVELGDLLVRQVKRRSHGCAACGLTLGAVGVVGPVALALVVTAATVAATAFPAPAHGPIEAFRTGEQAFFLRIGERGRERC